jgi:hypothetical protein
MSAVLLVRLKITDLAAWTALEAGRKLLPPGYALDRVVREQLVVFEPEPGAGAEAFEDSLEVAVRTTNFFVNPNKESFRFLRASSRGTRWEAPEGAWGLLARARGDTRDEGLRARLLREHPMRGLAAIRRAKAWWLWTRGPGEDKGARECRARLGDLTSPSMGLLVNPHSEASLWIDVGGGIEWARVESFLRDPADSLREAA